MFSKKLPCQRLHLGLVNSIAFFGTICFVSNLIITLTSNSVKAEIIPDDTLGNESSVVTPLTPNFDEINGGAVRGSNLFHSFEKFNIQEGHRAVFKNPNGIENIIGRVTGGRRSEILGTLGVVNGNANLFLINPNGIIFGPNAKLLLGGSFVGTTANAIKFGDRDFFSASAPDAPPLLTIKPSALQFNQAANQPITIQSTAGLKVPSNQSLLFVGGDVNVEGGLLRTQGGRIELRGLAGAGAVGLNIDGNNLSSNFLNGIALADISLSNGAIVETDFETDSTSGLSKGDIQVQGKRVMLADGSEISASTFGAESGGTLTVNASESVELTGGGRLLAEAEGSGNGGTLTIETGKLIVRDGSQVAAGAFKEGSGGKLTITASEIELSGTSEDGKNLSSILTQTDGAGNAGDLTINTKRLTVRDGARVSTATKNSGQAGRLTVTSSDFVKLIGESKLGDNPQPSVLSASAESSGKPGELRIETKQLIIQDGARALTSNLGTNTEGGTLTVKASELVQLNGTSANGEVRSGLLVGTQGFGRSGELTIETPSLQVQNGAIVSARTLGQGQGGSVIINASDSVELISTSAANIPEPSSITTETQSDGDAGILTIKTGQLSIKNGAEISSSSSGEGSAGNIQLQAESVHLDQGNIISQTASGDGGNITLSLKDILLLHRNSQISTTAGTAEADGDGGNITINAKNSFIVAVPDEDSDITANAFSGKGGQVNIEATSIYGIQFREKQNSQTNDITASSQLGVDGTVELNTPEIDPNSGLIDLPNISIDTEIAQGCNSPTYAQSSFVITGRGGLPPNPKDILSADATQIDWVSVKPSNNNRSLPPVITKAKTSAPKPIVEATGAILNDKGQIVLTANPSGINSGISKHDLISCQNY